MSGPASLGLCCIKCGEKLRRASRGDDGCLRCAAYALVEIEDALGEQDATTELMSAEATARERLRDLLEGS